MLYIMHHLSLYYDAPWSGFIRALFIKNRIDVLSEESDNRDITADDACVTI